MTEVLSMGGYAAYVWSSFGLTFAVLVICIVQGRSRHRKTIDDVKRRIRAMESS